MVHYASGRASEQRRRQIVRTATLVGAGVLVLLLVRLGLPWLAAIGAALITALRWVGPLALRFLPWLMSILSLTPTAARTSQNKQETRDGTMTRLDALAVLGLHEGASDEDIRNAYSALIKKVHPDRGGSAYLAARVNLARDLLLPRDH